MANAEAIQPALSVDWKGELKETAFKYHVLVAWVAVILNPIWAIPDYFNIPGHFTDFLVFRLVVSVGTLMGIIYKSRFRNRPSVIALIPFLGITLQNAYMYSVMDVAELQKHTFALSPYLSAQVCSSCGGLFIPWWW